MGFETSQFGGTLSLQRGALSALHSLLLQSGYVRRYSSLENGDALPSDMCLGITSARALGVGASVRAVESCVVMVLATHTADGCVLMVSAFNCLDGVSY